MESFYPITILAFLGVTLGVFMRSVTFLLQNKRMPAVLMRNIVRQLHSIYMLTLVIGGAIAIIAWGGFNLAPFSSAFWNWGLSFLIVMVSIGSLRRVSSAFVNTRSAFALYAVSSVTLMASLSFVWFLYKPAMGT